MNTGATDLPNGVQVLNVGATPLIYQNSSAKIMSRRHNRYRFSRNVESNLQALVVDEWKSRSDLLGFHMRREIQQDIRITIYLHFMMNRSRDDVPGSQVFPLG